MEKKKAKRGRPVSPVSVARREFIKRWAVEPSVGIQEIADTIGCSYRYAVLTAGPERMAKRKAKHEENVVALQRSLPKILLQESELRS